MDGIKVIILIILSKETSSRTLVDTYVSNSFIIFAVNSGPFLCLFAIFGTRIPLFLFKSP